MSPQLYAYKLHFETHIWNLYHPEILEESPLLYTWWQQCQRWWHGKNGTITGSGRCSAMDIDRRTYWNCMFDYSTISVSPRLPSRYVLAGISRAMTSKKRVSLDATDVNNTCLPVRICNNNCLSHQHNRHMHFTMSIILLLLLWIRVRMRWCEVVAPPMSVTESRKNILWMNFGYEYFTSVRCVCSDAESNGGNYFEFVWCSTWFCHVNCHTRAVMRWAVPCIYLNVYSCDFVHIFNYISRASVYPRCFGVGNRFSTRPRCRKFHTWINSPARLIFINMSEILFASSTEGAQHHAAVCVWIFWYFISQIASSTKTAKKNDKRTAKQASRNNQNKTESRASGFVWCRCGSDEIGNTHLLSCLVPLPLPMRFYLGRIHACIMSPSLHAAFRVDSSLFCIVSF